MQHIPRTGAAAMGLLALTLATMACTVKVSDRDSGGNADVEIRTPAGQLSVHHLDDASDTGLAVYPGAWPKSDRHGRDSANVDISTAWFGVKVAAASYESDADPDRIVDFYREALRQYGPVTECRGDVNFKGGRGAKRPVCKEALWSRNIELVSGSERRQHVVAVKPHGDYTEFAIVYVSTEKD